MKNDSSCVIIATLDQLKCIMIDRRVGAIMAEAELILKYFLNRALSLRAGDPDA